MKIKETKRKTAKIKQVNSKRDNLDLSRKQRGRSQRITCCGTVPSNNGWSRWWWCWLLLPFATSPLNRKTLAFFLLSRPLPRLPFSFSFYPKPPSISSHSLFPLSFLVPSVLPTAASLSNSPPFSLAVLLPSFLSFCRPKKNLVCTLECLKK